jgi:hypothetical protein
VISFSVPNAAIVGQSFARFRVSRNGGLDPVGAARDGEVEDHEVSIAAPPTDGGGKTWCQPPDLTPQGIDIRVDNESLADDFECKGTGWLTHIRLWGSWKDDRKGQIKKIRVAIWSDDPVGSEGADTKNTFSKPGPETLWSGEFIPGQFQETLYHTVGGHGEWWWDPASEKASPGGDTQVWQIDIDVEPADAFKQEGTAARPQIYWLIVQVDTVDGGFGWKTRQWPEHFMDDAVWEVASRPPGTWDELRYPHGHPYFDSEHNSIDLAFCLMFSTETPPPTILPGTATACPVVETTCPAIETKCPESPTKCPPTPTECHAIDTECPVVETKCPPVVTKCPESPTKCPPTPTECPAVDTECPVIETKCPPVKTKCPESPTKCPPTPTECHAIDTECPVIETKCPPVTTKCPESPTKCPPTPTECKAVDTECPVVETKCPPTKTKCPELLTKCPVKETTCPPEETKCPVEDTKCPPVQTRCPPTPTNCQTGRTICPPVDTQCPVEDTKCPPVDTQCPVKKTTCPVIRTECPPLQTLCSCAEDIAVLGILCPIVETSCPTVGQYLGSQ